MALDRQRSGLQVVQSALQAQIEAVGAAFSAPFAESEPGERADTLHVAGLPRRWFAPLAGGLSSTGEGDDTPTAVSHGCVCVLRVCSSCTDG